MPGAAAGRGAAGRGGRRPTRSSRTERVLASVIEAVIGACYLAYGYEKTAEAVVEAFAPEIEQALDAAGGLQVGAAGAPRPPRRGRAPTTVGGGGRAAARPDLRGRRRGRRARRSAAAPGARRRTPSRRRAPRSRRWTSHESLPCT